MTKEDVTRLMSIGVIVTETKMLNHEAMFMRVQELRRFINILKGRKA